MRDAESADEMHGPTIVIVNDEPCMLEMLEMVIQVWFKPAKILLFNDPEKALEELLRSDPDLLITDDRMPRLSGHDLIERLADRNLAYPIVLISGCGEQVKQWVQEWADHGLNISFLDVPLNMEELRHLLTKHLGPEAKK